MKQNRIKLGNFTLVEWEDGSGIYAMPGSTIGLLILRTEAELEQAAKKMKLGFEKYQQKIVRAEN